MTSPLQSFKKLIVDQIAELEKGFEQARGEGRRELSDHLNRSMRRLRQAENADERNSALLDATAGFAARSELFAIAGELLKGRGALRGIEIPVSDAPAFASAVDSADTVVSIRAARQLSQKIASVLGESDDVKVYLVPILVRQKVVGVLYAEAVVDLAGLELLATFASAFWDGSPEPLSALRPVPVLPEWSTLPRETQDVHIRARRFARVQVAEMRLYKTQAVQSGRSRNNLYAELKDEIDSAREIYRRQFAAGPVAMVDYLHLELVRTLANDNAALLGPEYPGPLV